MASFEYQPKSSSFVLRSVLVTLFSLYLMNASSQDNLSYCVDMIWDYTMTCQHKDAWQKSKGGLVEITGFVLFGHGQVVAIAPLVVQPLWHLQTTTLLGLTKPTQLLLECILFLMV